MSADAPIILCSTPRLARSLQMVEQRKQLQSGVKQWQAPHITTLSDWLNSIIEPAILLGEIDANNVPTNALNATQEGLLWEQSIAHCLKSNAAKDLFDTSGLASAAIEANKLLTEWNISLDLENATEETVQFLEWQQDFQQRCKQTNSLEAVRFTAWQLNCLKRDAGSLPNAIALAGFDRTSPHLKQLTSILKTRGVSIQDYPATLASAQKLEHRLLHNQDAECRAAVAWAKAQLAQNPQAKLAIVVPALEALRSKLSHLLDDTFHPETSNPSLAEAPRCYDFTLGLPLASVPIIETALNLLRLGWLKQKTPQSTFTQLTLSPYWSASQQEVEARAKLDARIRKDLPLSINTFTFIRYIRHIQQSEQPLAIEQFADDCQQLLSTAQAQSKPQTPAIWATIFKEVLSATHWQGERSLSSHEYQAVQSFERVLLQFSGLDSLLGKVNANEAIKRLSQLTQAQIFQPESKTTPSIQVMGMLESVAEPLDAIWVMGMNDNVWPPIARPNALIPAEIQRKAGTPNASSEVQNAFGLAIHQRLTKSAHHVIFSSAEKEDERQLRTSPFVLNISQSVDSSQSNSEMLSIQTLAESLADASKQQWQWLDDAQAPVVSDNEQISGGTALLKNQAICPAWAFFQQRLGVRALHAPTDGLDAMERGTLVHAVLAGFWEGRNSTDLAAMSDTDLTQDLETKAKAVLATFNETNNQNYSATLLTLEAERLVRLSFAWLTDIDQQRPQSFTVNACEARHTINIEGILITFIVDRMDTLTDGRLVILDYKTSSQLDYKNWLQNKITEPQLPIYAAFVMQDADIAAVCYAKVRSAEHRFVGIAAETDILQNATAFSEEKNKKIFDENIFPDWESIIAHWRQRIADTAKALKAGDAAIQFDDEKQLAYCEVLPLLRLPERQLQFEHRQSNKSS